MKTTRTAIQPLSKEHFPDILKMYQEKDTWRFISPHAGKSIVYYENFLEKKVNDNKTEVGFWSVYDFNGDFIGTINLNQYMKEDIVHMGVHLKKEYWKKGYAKELMQRLLLHAKEDRKLKEVYAIVVYENEASKNIFDSLGFEIKFKREIDEEILFFFHKILVTMPCTNY